MADIKEDVGHRQQHLVLAVEAPKSQAQVENEEQEEQTAEAQQNTRTKRVASLDIFRGLTVAVNFFDLVNIELSDFLAFLLHCSRYRLYFYGSQHFVKSNS